MLGHTSIASTLVYTHLVNFEEDEELLKFGFVYITDRDLIRIYRKHKLAGYACVQHLQEWNITTRVGKS